MKKFWSGFVAASFVATVGLSAQQAPPTTPPAAPGGAQQPAPSAQASQSKTVTLSGCIQNAPAAAATATAGGASASASAAPKFVLSTKAGGAAGAGAAVGTSGTATRYQLDGEEKAISPHLNHQVEITGTLQPAGAAAAAGATGAGPTLKVDSVKMVAATCS
jgi:hypothetical protein